MAGSVNKVILIGNLGAAPDIKTFQNGGRLANLRLATSESWTDKQSGERRENTQWHQVVVKNEGLVGVVERFCGKGDKLYIEGQLETRKWQDNGGEDRWSTEVVVKGPAGKITMLGSPKGDGGSGPSSPSRRGAGSSTGSDSGSAPQGERDGAGGNDWSGLPEGGAGGPPSGGGFDNDFDDDVPF